MAYRVGETYGLQGEDAEKALEVIEMRKANNILGTITNSHPLRLGIVSGIVFMYWGRPVHRLLYNYHSLFRKPWMRLPWNLLVFTCGYVGGT